MINENILAARSRAAGDVIRLGGMTKSLKKEYINRKFPARLRPAIPVVCDADGVVAVPGRRRRGPRKTAAGRAEGLHRV